MSRILFGSSSSVYGDSTPAPFREDAVAIAPVSPYAATKRAGELLLRSVAPIYGFRVASLRFFTVYGPRQRPDLAIRSFTRKMLAGETITLFGDGTQARDYTYCDDIIAGVLAALRWSADAPIGVEDFNLGGNRSVPTGAMVEEIARALGITPTIQWAPMQPGDVQQTAADLTKSGAVLVFRPQGAMKLGHVAMVNKVITDRIVQVTHANWSRINGTRGQVEQDVTVIDVSPKGDWSQVKVWYDPVRDLGSTTYPTYGFIYQDQNAMRLAAAVRGVQTAMNSVASIGPNAVAASGQVFEQVSDAGDRLAALIQQSLQGDSAQR